MAKEDKKGKPAKARQLDFTDVKEGGGRIRPTRQTAGDYKGKVLSVETVPKKKDPTKDQWLYIIQVGPGKYPLYCGFEKQELWKIRNLFVAAGVPVPSKRQSINPNLPVGKEIGVTLEDDEYNNKAKSTIAATMALSELDLDDTDTGEEDEEKPAKKKGKKGKKGKKKKDMEELDIDDL